MKNGFTTGSCAAAAAKAAAIMLLTGVKKERIGITTPKGVRYDAQITDIKRESAANGLAAISCAVRKDGGDDPDVTTGTLIYATVALSDKPGIEIDGGEGIGRVTKPGLDQPVGAAAINSVPRLMIEENIREVAEAYGYDGGFRVVISAPEGTKIAAKTMNPRLGIEGGISILGTTGIVEPMSTEAVIATVKAQLSVRRAGGSDTAILVFGNIGARFLRDRYGIAEDEAAICSNYIGRAIDLACEQGFKKILICGHAGKLVKLAGGIMNTHSSEADSRMELIAASAARSGADGDMIRRILSCSTTDEAFELLAEDSENEDFGKAPGDGLLDKTSQDLLKQIVMHVSQRIERAAGASKPALEVILYTGVNSSKYQLLAATPGSDSVFNDDSPLDKKEDSNPTATSEADVGVVHFVGAGPGAADLITVRGRRLISQADLIIYAGSLVNPALLDYARDDCKVLNSAHMHLEQIVKAMAEAAGRGKTVVRLHTGEPSVYGAVREQMEALESRGVSYDSTPGVSACFGAAAAMDLEYTLPGISQTLIITRMEGRTPVPEAESIERLASHRASMAVYLSAGMLPQLQSRLLAGGYDAGTPCALVYRATWSDQKILKCTLGELASTGEKNGIDRFAVVLVGEALDAHSSDFMLTETASDRTYSKSKLYDKTFETGFRNADKGD